MPFTFIDGWNQFRMDINGKDSFRGVSLSYAWMANQTGHMLLGLVVSAILYVLLPILIIPILVFFVGIFSSPTAVVSSLPTWLSFVFDGSAESLTIWAVTIMILIWLVVESYFVYKALADVEPHNNYNIEWSNVLDDMSFDLIFFFIGGGIFAIIKTPTLYPVLLVFFAVMIFIIAIAGVYWYVIKCYVQIAGFPLQFRLSQWDRRFSTSSVEQVITFMGDDYNNDVTFHGILTLLYRRLTRNMDPQPFVNGPGRHLLIFGDTMSGKSKLAIGCATEFAINGRECAYTTLADIFYHFKDEGQIKARKTNYNIYWTLERAEVIVIDDINAFIDLEGLNREDVIQGLVAREDLNSTSQFFNKLKNNNSFRTDLFTNKRIIWVFNSEELDGSDLSGSQVFWQRFFEICLGINNGNNIPAPNEPHYYISNNEFVEFVAT